MNVIVNYIVGEPQAKEFAQSLCDRFGTRCMAVYGDISKAEDIDAIFELAEKEYGHVDVLVNNAGIWPATPIEEMPDEEWKRVIDINLNGTYLFSKRAACTFFKARR